MFREEMQLAQVKHVDKVKGYGFADVTDLNGNKEKTVFFLFPKQRPVCQWGDQPFVLVKDLSRQTGVDVDDYIYVHAELNEAVTLRNEKQGSKWRAICWVLAEDFDRAADQIEARPFYRLVNRRGRIPKSRLQDKPQIQILWEGKNIIELRETFSLRHYFLTFEEFAGQYFEVQNPDTGIWTPTSYDPRTGQNDPNLSNMI